MGKLKNPAVLAAEKYLGQEEVAGNMGFKSTWFDKLMRKVGFYNRAPWCAFAVKRVWMDAYPEDKRLAKLMNGNALKTYENLEAAGFETGTEARAGAIACWRHYRNGKPVGRTGHTGIVEMISGSLNGSAFYCYEGNTNEAGSREGDRFLRKLRYFTWTTDKGLRLIGFVYYTPEANENN